jgi:DNA-binding PadR family transcriptional regulator
MDGTYAYRWDKHRWERLRSEGWISVWRERNRTTQKYAIYQVSQKGKNLIMRIYRILLGEEDVTLSSRSVYYNNKSYTAKVRNKAIDDMVKDKDR